MNRVLSYLSACALICAARMAAESKQPITARTCVEVRYLLEDDSLRNPIQINPQGTQAAYLIKSPDIATNENDIDLYVAPLVHEGASTARLLLHGTGMSQIQWLKDGERIAMLIRHEGHIVVATVEVTTGKFAVLASLPRDITEYTMSGDASFIVVAANKSDEEQGRITHSPSEMDYGYQIPFETKYMFAHPEKEIYLVRRGRKGAYGKPKQVTVLSPFSHRRITRLFCVLNLRLSLSPDGKYLTITYIEPGDNLPAEWKSNARVSGILKQVNEVEITAVDEIATGQVTLPLRTPWSYNVPLWSSDGHKFIEVGEPPVGSSWDKADAAASEPSIQMYSVDPRSQTVERIESVVAKPALQPLAWKSTGDLIVAGKQDEVSRFTEHNGAWTFRSKIPFPMPADCKITSLASDGEHFIGDCQNASTPPKIFSSTVSESQYQTVAQLNPKMNGFSIAPSRTIHWKTATGYDASGLLVLPVGYQEGIRYPLVVQTYPVYEGGFACDSGDSHDPSTAPQPLANVGIMYLLRSRPPGAQSDADYYPKGYPGGVAEAAFQMDLTDSAVKKLSDEGLVDSSKVGLVGFSRSGWYTLFTLANSKLQYRAATIADGTHYSLGDYWLFHSDSMLDPFDALYGGPPYGESLINWMKYSISFNLDKIHTPLLLETMGNGAHYDNLNTPPIMIARMFEILTAFHRLHRPVELYFYPNEGHQPDHPRARLASLQRNLEWYRFWLQGREPINDTNPALHIDMKEIEEQKRPLQGR